MIPEADDAFSPRWMEHIQSRLPVKEAARTSVLSKSWRHAWSTNPTLRFKVGSGKGIKLAEVDRTLIRYLRDNLPIEKFNLLIDIESQESASHAEKWVESVATKTCLKELSLSILLHGASFMLPHNLLSGENLTKIRVSASHGTHSVRMTTTPSVINCVSLRELHLEGVCMSEEVLHAILSSCSSLVKLVLLGCCKGFKTIKVNNLLNLYKLRISSDALHPTTTALEISNVPNLGKFSCDLDFGFSRCPPLPFNAHSISLGRRVTKLMLGGVIRDNVCLDMFKSEFPFLENLSLNMRFWMSGSFRFTCDSVKRLSLVSCQHVLTDVQVYAPNLLFFKFDGDTLPSLLFPDSSLEEITVSLSLDLPVDVDFFLKMREALTLSRKCYLHITTSNCSNLPFDVKIDDLRTRLLFPPATNVQQLSFQTITDECLWERSSFFDAFFEICHPEIVLAIPDLLTRNNHFCRLMLREVLEKKTEAETAYWPRLPETCSDKRKSPSELANPSRFPHKLSRRLGSSCLPPVQAQVAVTVTH